MGFSSRGNVEGLIAQATASMMEGVVRDDVRKIIMNESQSPISEVLVSVCESCYWINPSEFLELVLVNEYEDINLSFFSGEKTPDQWGDEEWLFLVYIMNGYLQEVVRSNNQGNIRKIEITRQALYDFEMALRKKIT